MIIGLAGYAGSGKSTVARFLVEHHAFEEISFAEPMKVFCREVLGFSRDQLWGPSSLRDAIDPRYGKSPREALQQIGTEWGRAFYQDIWVDCALRTARERLSFSRSVGVVFSDVRFENELDAIQAAGGSVWRVVRPGLGAAGGHASENNLTDRSGYNRIIDNQGGSLEDLAALVARAISGKS